MTVDDEDDIDWENDGDWFGEANDFAVRIKAERAELRDQLAAALSRAEVLEKERRQYKDWHREASIEADALRARAQWAESGLSLLQWVLFSIADLLGLPRDTPDLFVTTIKTVETLVSQTTALRELRDSWVEAQEGNVHPISQLWDGIDVDQESEQGDGC